jgi:hypothetical protein
MLRFKICASNSIYKIKINTSFKNLNNIKLSTPLENNQFNVLSDDVL